MGVDAHGSHAVGSRLFAGEGEQLADDAAPPTGRIHGAAVHRGVGTVGQPLPFQSLISGLGLIGVAEHSHHASLVQGNIGGTCRHVSLPGTPVGITALPLIDAHSGHVGPGLLGDSDHGIHLLRFRNNDLHEKPPINCADMPGAHFPTPL